MKGPFLLSNISSVRWSNLTVGFWIYLDNTIFFSIKKRQEKEQGKGVWQEEKKKACNSDRTRFKSWHGLLLAE